MCEQIRNAAPYNVNMLKFCLNFHYFGREVAWSVLKMAFPNI